MTAIGEDFRGPDGRVGYLLRQAHQAFRAVAQTELAAVGLTLPQYSVLSVASVRPGLSGAELARDSMLTPQTTNEIISLLAKAALVEFRADTRDRRLRRVMVTETGHDLLDRARPIVYGVEQRMTATLSDADLATFRGWLTDCARDLATEA
jgi:DNA-binding MarR family transcriptional regulator